MRNLPKIVLALIGQGIALALLAGSIWLASFIIPPPYPPWPLVIIQGVLAALIGSRLGLPNWWWWIQIVLPIALYGVLQLDVNPAWALLAFVLLWLVFANASKERVPLYLTNPTTRQALKELVENKSNVRFLDLGCGLGGNVAFMSRLPNVCLSKGVETAPLPLMVSKVHTLLRGGEVVAENLWNTELGSFDLVYAFLSPEPMPKLWEKVKAEMKKGSVFVSNSFAVPDVKATEVWELSDGRKTKLYIYKM